MSSTETFAQPVPPPLALRPSSASPRVTNGGGGGGGPRSPLGASASGRRMSPALLSEVEAAWELSEAKRILARHVLGDGGCTLHVR